MHDYVCPKQETTTQMDVKTKKESRTYRGILRLCGIWIIQASRGCSNLAHSVCTGIEGVLVHYTFFLVSYAFCYGLKLTVSLSRYIHVDGDLRRTWVVFIVAYCFKRNVSMTLYGCTLCTCVPKTLLQSSTHEIMPPTEEFESLLFRKRLFYSNYTKYLVQKNYTKYLFLFDTLYEISI